MKPSEIRYAETSSISQGGHPTGDPGFTGQAKEEIRKKKKKRFVHETLEISRKEERRKGYIICHVKPQ